MKTKLFAAISTLSVILCSCEKQEIKTTPLASLLLTNVVNGGGNLMLGTNATPVYNNYFQTYGVLSGNREVKLVDTTGGINKVYYNQTMDFVNGGVYSLFLGGTPEAVDAVFIREDNIPSHADDVFGIRVINLSFNSAAVSLNLLGTNNRPLFSNLAYKAISNFKDISSKAEEGDKTFEFRNASTGKLISTFVVPAYDMPRFKNITVVFAGKLDAETILRINNY